MTFCVNTSRPPLLSRPFSSQSTRRAKLVKYRHLDHFCRKQMCRIIYIVHFYRRGNGGPDGGDSGSADRVRYVQGCDQGYGYW